MIFLIPTFILKLHFEIENVCHVHSQPKIKIDNNSIPCDTKQIFQKAHELAISRTFILHDKDTEKSLANSVKKLSDK